MTFELPKHGLGLDVSTISDSSSRVTPTPASINASADRAMNVEMRHGHLAALEQAGALMLLIMVWVGLHALKWAGKPF